MNRHHYIDPTIAAILDMLAPSNAGVNLRDLALPVVTPPRDPGDDDVETDTLRPNAPRQNTGD
jgi:hypothetical protein